MVELAAQRRGAVALDVEIETQLAKVVFEL